MKKMKRILISIVAGVTFLGGTTGGLAQTNILTVRPDDETRRLLREATEDKWFKKDSLLPALVGGFLAAAAGVWVARYTHRLEVRQKQREAAAFATNVLSAIRRDLEVLREIYDKGAGAELAKVIEGRIFEKRFALTQDWFTTFTANVAHLGSIDGELSQQIITVNALLKGLVEEYRINNDLLAQRQKIIIQHYFNPGNPQDAIARDTSYEWLIAQTIKLKQADAALKEAVDKLLTFLDRHSIK